MFLNKSNSVSLGTLNNGCRNIWLLLWEQWVEVRDALDILQVTGQTPPQRTTCLRMSTVLRLRSLQLNNFCTFNICAIVQMVYPTEYHFKFLSANTDSAPLLPVSKQHCKLCDNSISPDGWLWKSVLFFFLNINLFIYWRLITLQHCIGFAIHQHESTTGVHVFPILNPPPTSLPDDPSLWVIPVHQPQASCILHRTWTGDSFLIWYYTCFNAILPKSPTLSLSHRVQKTVLYIYVSFAVTHTGLSLPSF